MSAMTWDEAWNKLVERLKKAEAESGGLVLDWENDLAHLIFTMRAMGQDPQPIVEKFLEGTGITVAVINRVDAENFQPNEPTLVFPIDPSHKGSHVSVAPSLEGCAEDEPEPTTLGGLPKYLQD